MLSAAVLAQNSPTEFGIFLGGSTYRGDVVEPDVFTLKDTRLAFGFFGRYALTPQWQARASLNLTRLAAEDQNYDTDWGDQRSFRFSNLLAELAVVGEWHPLQPAANILPKKRWSPYVFAGLGVAYHNPKPVFEHNKIDQLSAGIEADQNASINRFLVTIPFGVGIKVHLKDGWTLSVEGGARPAFTDYLDGISQAGMADHDDWYGFGGILIGYRFGK